MVNELSLFSGAGGGLLGTKLLGWRAVGYVERDAYCQAVLQARIRDGLLDPAPIFGDIREFLRSGDCDRFAGRVDVVTAGFPCQPFSVAGKRLAHADERNLWPETADVLRRVRPRFALLENVPGLASHPYFGTVLGDLAALGFDAEWTVLGADDCGAPHRRKRLWILAYAADDGQPLDGSWGCFPKGQQLPIREQSGDRRTGGITRRGDVPDPELWFALFKQGRIGRRRPERMEPEWAGEVDVDRDGGEESVADADRAGNKAERGFESRGRGPTRESDRESVLADAHFSGLQNDSRRSAHEELAGDGAVDGCGWWSTDPADEGPESQPGLGGLAPGLAGGLGSLGTTGAGMVPRVARGVPNRVDRLRALGNGQVPATVVRAWHELYGRIGR